MRRLKPGQLCKIRLGYLTAKMRRGLVAGSCSLAECRKKDDNWVFAGDHSAIAPRQYIASDDVFLLLEIIDFVDYGEHEDAAVLLYGEKTVLCPLAAIKRANKYDLARSVHAGYMPIELVA